MRLTRQSEIAIAILAACAGAAGKTIRTMQAAEAADATKDHAADVVNYLVHEGFLKTMRGRQGGISLAVPATEILLGDVLRRMQPDLVRHANIHDLNEPGTANAALSAIVGAAEATFLTFMDRFTVADL
ncbi:Rrf2 family transcriptional regulator [Agrobacterium sp. S2]|nr:Rrf2 family transcriptional regulator [Agrobacterium sp. S2]